jgi:type I restriction enzyme S subunit
VRNTEGSVREYLFYENFANMRMPIPTFAEQQKIADILATCDRVIELKQQLLEEKRHQKQWLMQKLLDPDSGVRLPGFIGSIWNVCSIGDITDIYSGGTPDTETEVFWDGDVLWCISLTQENTLSELKLLFLRKACKNHQQFCYQLVRY